MLEQNTFSNTLIDSNADSNTGSYIGGYRITRELASSTTSRILLGETASLTAREPVVIKWFSTLHLSTTQARQEFLREAGRLRRLQHPALLSILSTGIYTDTPYLILPYMSQGSLFDRLQQPDGRDWARPRALSLTRQLGQALAYAHRHTIVHGNLTMHNILLKNQEDVLLTDFSLASLARSQFSSSNNSSLDTPHPHPLTPAEDVYALGCIAYELLTDHQPFPMQEGNALSSETTLPIALSWFNTNVAPYIEEAILKALAPQPAARYSDINAFLRALDPPTTILPSVPSDGEKLMAPDQVPTVPIATLTGALLDQVPTAPQALLTTENTPTAVMPLSGQRQSCNPTSRLPSSQRPWSLFLLAGTLCLLIFGLIGTQLLARFPSDDSRQHRTTSRATPNPRANALPIPQANSADQLTASAQTSSTPIITPQIRSTPYPTPMLTSHPKNTPQPTAAPPSSQGATGSFFATPSHLSPQSCTLEQQWYHCSISLTLSEDASGISAWESSTDGLPAFIMPDRGIISPGEHIQVIVQISARCPLKGSLVFNSLDVSTTVAWSC